MPKVSQEHVEARRAQILEGARRCFARYGYDGATVPRLEQAIGLSHGAIFNYYRSKLDLFVALALEDHRRFGRLYEALGFAGMARHIAEVDPAWLSVYLELHRRLYTDPELKKAWRKCAVHDVGHVHDFAHTVLYGLVFMRAAGVEIDVEPIIASAQQILDR
ncbi:MAG: helix-turn-helix domain-containing protein [Actinomycetota bacterium]